MRFTTAAALAGLLAFTQVASALPSPMDSVTSGSSSSSSSSSGSSGSDGSSSLDGGSSASSSSDIESGSAAQQALDKWHKYLWTFTGNFTDADIDWSNFDDDAIYGPESDDNEDEFDEEGKGKGPQKHWCRLYTFGQNSQCPGGPGQGPSSGQGAGAKTRGYFGHYQRLQTVNAFENWSRKGKNIGFRGGELNVGAIGFPLFQAPNCRATFPTRHQKYHVKGVNLIDTNYCSKEINECFFRFPCHY